MSLGLKKGDEVIILAGKEKNKKGKILKTFPKRSRAVVEGLNFVKIHRRPTQDMPQGGVVEQEASLHISNLQLVCPKCHIRTKIKRKQYENKILRYCVKCKEMIDKG